MKRRPLTKTELIARLPRGLRPKLDDDQWRDLATLHTQHVDDIATGRGDEDTLWQLVGSVLTWSKVAELLRTGEDEMRAQLAMVTTMVERFGRTGRVGFSGVEYQLAKRGLQVMDELAAVVDRPTAIAATEWSEAEVNRLANASRQRQEAAHAA